jgi:exosortase
MEGRAQADFTDEITPVVVIEEAESALPTSAVLPAQVNPRPLLWLLAAQVPLAAAYYTYLWNRPHYQIFPLAVSAALFLAWHLWRRSTVTPQGRPFAVALLLAIVWMCQAVALVISSFWLVGLSLIVVFATVIYAAGGLGLVARCWALIAIVALCVPPPFGNDFRLVLGLRALATSQASAVLDWLKVANLPSGNVLRIGAKPLFIEDACSGVNSLFAILCCVLIYCALLRRHWVHTLLLLAIGMVWLTAANVARIVIIALGVARWDADLTTGWRHELLGLGTYATVVLLIWSVDQFLVFLGRRNPEKAKTIAVVQPERSAWPGLPLESRIAWAAVAAFAAVSVPYYILYVTLAPWPSLEKIQELSRRPKKEDLFADGLGWRLTDFKHENRNEGSEYGEHSSVWTGRLATDTTNVAVKVSVDYPFRGWHDLSICYKALGWVVINTTKVEFLKKPDAAVELRLEQPSHDGALVLFAAFDEEGELLTCQSQHPWPRPGSLLARLTGGPAVHDRQPNCQVQLLLHHGGDLDDSTLQAARQLFEKSCIRIQRRFK